MLIKYIGHSCFKLRDYDTEFSIIFDPYKPGSVPGYRDVKDTASMVLCSHEHDDHCGSECVVLEESDTNPYDIEVIDTYHDPESGSLRGMNRIHIVTHRETGEKLIHYGDIGEKLDNLLTDENLELLSGADIALVPVGGTYTYDADEALDLIERTKPNVTIPMHFRSEQLGIGYPNIGTIDEFASKAVSRGMVVRTGHVYFYDSQQSPLDECILVIRPQNS